MALSARTRSWLAMQGYDAADEAALEEVALWTRFSPALCMLVAGAGTILASPSILGALAITAALGAVFPAHPFDAIYNVGIRRVLGTRRLPPNGAPRRVACAVAAVWLAITALLFATGLTVAGYVLGGAIVCTAGTLALTGFCVPSYIFRACEARLARVSERQTV